MATNRIRCAAPADVVYRVLCDPRSYAYFVVGSRAVPRFDSTWPATDSTFDHRLGLGVTWIRDHTRVLDAVEGRRLVLRTYMRPLAVNDVTFELFRADGGTRVVITETAVSGPATRQVLRSVAEVLFWLRNAWVCRRLRRLVEHRARRLATTADASGGGSE